MPGEPNGIHCHMCADSAQLEGHISLTESKINDCDDYILEPCTDDELGLASRGRPQFKEITRRLRLRRKTIPKEVKKKSEKVANLTLAAVAKDGEMRDLQLDCEVKDL